MRRTWIEQLDAVKRFLYMLVLFVIPVNVAVLVNLVGWSF